MSVKLISYTQASPEFLQSISEDLNVQDLVAYCARVSNPSNQHNTETSERLLRYLIKHKHWSPFEMVSACLEIETTRDIAHQIVRHRSFSFQEFSQRYANPNEIESTFVKRECRIQDVKNRQNSIECDDQKLIWQWDQRQSELIEQARQIYDWAIAQGIAKEQARAVLPEGLTKTRLMMHGTLRSWIHYVELRSSNGTQKEHAEIAKQCGNILGFIFPMMLERK